jgi:hypothetical protein
VAAILSSAVSLAGLADAQELEYTEAEVKAANLYHFMTYVQWPDEDETPISIAVLGAPGVVEQLEAFLPGKRVRNRALEVRGMTDARDFDPDDDVLFVGAEFDDRLDEIVAAVGTRPVLVVTDARDALTRGAIINFMIVDQTVRFEISLVNAQRVGLIMSSRLLNVAMHVETSHLWIGTQPLAPMLAERAQHCGRACRAMLDGGGRAQPALARVHRERPLPTMGAEPPP